MDRQPLRKLILLISFLAFPITLYYLSPYLMIAAAAERIVNASVIFWALFFGLSLIVGRLACASICPLGAVQMLLGEVYDKKLINIRYLYFVKYALGVLWVGVFLLVLAMAGGYAKIDLLYQTPYIISVADLHGIIMYFLMISLAFLPALLLGRMAFCRYFCPFCVLNIAGTRIKEALKLPSLGLKPDATRCISCGKCDKECPMSLKVEEMVRAEAMGNGECILCGSCIDRCPKKAISYKW